MADPPFRRLFDHRSEALADRVQQAHQFLIPPAAQQALDVIDHVPALPTESARALDDALLAAIRRAVEAGNDAAGFRDWLWTRASMTQLLGLHRRLSAIYVQLLNTAPGDPWHDQVAAALAKRADVLICAIVALESF